MKSIPDVESNGLNCIHIFLLLLTMTIYLALDKNGQSVRWCILSCHLLLPGCMCVSACGCVCIIHMVFSLFIPIWIPVKQSVLKWEEEMLPALLGTVLFSWPVDNLRHVTAMPVSHLSTTAEPPSWCGTLKNETGDIGHALWLFLCLSGAFMSRGNCRWLYAFLWLYGLHLHMSNVSTWGMMGVFN